LLQTVLQAAPTALLVCDAAGIIVLYNDAAAALLGYAPQEVIGQDVSILQPPPGAGLCMVVGGNPDTYAGGRRYLPYCRKGGGQVTLDSTITVTLSQGQRLFILALRDGDMLSSLADGWTEAEERLGSVAQNLPGIIFQRVRQPDGTVYYPFFSSGVQDILGYRPEDMRVTQDGCLDCIHWADRADYMAHLHESAQSLIDYTEEWRAITRDGQVRWLSGTLKPERLPSGDVLWDAVLIDVTDRMRAEHRLEMIMDHAADCVLTMDEEGQIESANAAVERTFGWSTDALLGKDMSFLCTDEAGGDGNYIRHYLTTGESAMLGQGPVELNGRHKDGAVFPIELSLSEVLTEGKRLFIAILRDITKRRETEHQLHETEQRLLNIADNIQGIVFQRQASPEGALYFSYVSEGCRSILGIDPEDLIADGDLFLDLMDPGDRGAYLDAMRRSADTLEAMESDLKFVNRQGEERWLREWSRPRRNNDGSTVWDGVALDVTDRKRAEEELTFLAYYDPLTGLGNRSLFIERFGRAKGFAARIDAWVAVLSLGLDRFTIINATLGHSKGDQVLLAAARRIQETVDIGDLLCRAGGDRFLLMLTGVTCNEDIEQAVRQILARFEEPLSVEGKDLDVTVSIGAAVFPRNGDSAEALIMHSEAALHRAKSEGTASYQIFTEEMGERAQQTLSMQHRLRRALDNEEFVAYFQPQFETRSGKIVGMEALVRWISPEHGMIPPGAFIEVAEDFGLIDAMCEQVLRDACRWNKRWQDEGLAHVPVAVNISGRQFHNTRLLLHTVDSVLQEFQMDPQYLELELTESSAMSDPENAINVVRMLAERGISCSIDDFGTGYSSLSVLKRFPIRKLKIDRSFVNEVTTDPGDAAIVCAMIAMANALNLKVVAEGVETQDHLNFLHGVGCDQIQGFLMSRPLPGDAMEKMFRDRPQMPLPA
jgi:diguanylate cyclase (GGDEF)-like protein/PAS domain S-box-containing protein